MSPRPYRTERRRAAAEETRKRILDAASELLASSDGPQSFSIDAIARHADVGRMTVYYQFGSKPGLIEALFDHLATRSEIGSRLREAHAQDDALAALNALIAAFGHFWTTDRLLIRRLHAIAVLDLDIEPQERARNERRRSALCAILKRMVCQYGSPADDDFDAVLETLQGLTSFEVFDHLAGEDRTPTEIVPTVSRLATSIIGIALTAGGALLPDDTPTNP